MTRLLSRMLLSVSAALVMAASPALAQQPTPAPAPASTGGGGLVLSTTVATSEAIGPNGGPKGEGLPASFFIGVKLATLYVGAQLGYGRYGQDSPVPGGGTINNHAATLVLEPLIQLPILHGGGGRLEGYIQGGAGIGHTWSNDPGCDPNGGVCPTFFQNGSMLYTIEAGFGARYFLDPSFAIGALVGLRLDDTEGNNYSQTVINTFAGATFTAVFD